MGPSVLSVLSMASNKIGHQSALLAKSMDTFLHTVMITGVHEYQARRATFRISKTGRRSTKPANSRVCIQVSNALSRT